VDGVGFSMENAEIQCQQAQDKCVEGYPGPDCAPFHPLRSSDETVPTGPTL
jgi:hypothetical protein